ncbi:MAG: hypothetical protein ACSLE8_06220 [Rhodococcus sp. (in: high G+C Gram-positive bacteria)]
MNLTLDERERLAYMRNDQAALAVLQHSEEELLDGVPTEEELAAERAEAEAWEGLAMTLGALVCTLAEHMVDTSKAERRAAQKRLADLSRTFGRFIDPRRYVALTPTESINSLAADVYQMTEDVHSNLTAF